MAVSILVGDVFEQLRGLPADHFDCVVTSPPYWGLRKYLEDDHPDKRFEIGLEPTLAEHLAVMVEVFEAVRRVLKPTGTLWLNYGDCYATSPNGRSAADTKATGADDRTFRDKPFSTVGGGLKAKDLCMIPNRLAIALQDAGWWVRSEIVWGKTNPMPDSSGSARPSTSHEKIWMLAKSDEADVWRARDTGELSFCPDLTERCPLVTDPTRAAARWTRIGAFYDANAVLQGRTSDEDANGFRGGSYVGGKPGPRAVTGNKRTRGRQTHGRHTLGTALPVHERRGAIDPRHTNHTNHTGIANTARGEGRYLRNYEPAALTVWPMAIEPFKGAHFATFPTELAERCLKAGCPAGGTVLDPFGGAGTTALVAAALGLDCTLIELNEDYAAIAQRRLKAALAEVRGADDSRGLAPLPLFSGDAA
jgi:DNA modification methylase